MKKLLLLCCFALPLSSPIVGRTDEKPIEDPLEKPAENPPISPEQRALLTQNYAIIDKALLAGEFDKVEAMQSPEFVALNRKGEVSKREDINKNMRELFKMFAKMETVATKIDRLETGAAGPEATVTMTIQGRIKDANGKEISLKTVASSRDSWRPKADDAAIWQQAASQEIQTSAFIDGQEIPLP